MCTNWTVTYTCGHAGYEFEWCSQMKKHYWQGTVAHQVGEGKKPSPNYCGECLYRLGFRRGNRGRWGIRRSLRWINILRLSGAICDLIALKSHFNRNIAATRLHYNLLDHSVVGESKIGSVAKAPTITMLFRFPYQTLPLNDNTRHLSS
jgi:hypothetical protein